MPLHFQNSQLSPNAQLLPSAQYSQITITLLSSLPNALLFLQPTFTIRQTGCCLGTFRPRSHGGLSRRRLVAQRQAADLPCTDDCELPVARSSDRLFLASLKMKAEYNARTGRDCCYVALGELKEKNKKKRIRRS